MSSESARRARQSLAPQGRVRGWVGLLPLTLPLALGCADFERGPRIEGPDLADADAGIGGPAKGESGTGLSFAIDVQPLLLSDCQACHSSNGSASDTAFLLSGDAGADYQTTTRFINISDPLGSRLLAKARGDGHQPGAIYSESSDEHSLLLRWINDGALP